MALPLVECFGGPLDGQDHHLSAYPVVYEAGEWVPGGPRLVHVYRTSIRGLDYHGMRDWDGREIVRAPMFARAEG